MLQPRLLKGAEPPEGKTMTSTAWSELPTAGQPAALILAGRQAIVGGQDCVLAVDLDTHTVAWNLPVEGAAYGLAVADGRLYVSTDRACSTRSPRRAPHHTARSLRSVSPRRPMHRSTRRRPRRS